MPRLTFEVSCETQWGERVVVVGDGEQLGDWSPSSSSLELHTEDDSYPRWRGSLCVRPGQRLEFKFAVLEPTGPARWEEAIPNRLVLVPENDMELQAAFDSSGVAMMYEAAADKEAASLDPRRRRGHSVDEATWPLVPAFPRTSSKPANQGCAYDVEIGSPLDRLRRRVLVDSDDDESSTDTPVHKRSQPGVEEVDVSSQGTLSDAESQCAFVLTRSGFRPTGDVGSEAALEEASDVASTACPSPRRLASDGEEFCRGVSAKTPQASDGKVAGARRICEPAAVVGAGTSTPQWARARLYGRSQ